MAITSVVLTILYGQTRVAFSMCRDGLMPERLAPMWERTRTPVAAHARVRDPGRRCSRRSCRSPEIAELVNIGTLFAFFIVNIA